MPSTVHADFVIIGAGIVGLATARALSANADTLVLEAEPSIGAHQTGHNSGVIHAGLYYKPGSLKARLCTRGREQMYDFCRQHDIAHENCSKVVVATDMSEMPRLHELHRRALANGLDGVTLLDAAGVRAREPHAAGVAGLHVPQTGIADFGAVARAMAADLDVRTNERALAIDPSARVVSTAHSEIHYKHLINCAGLQCDRVARLAGLKPSVRIVPFRGEYWYLRPEARSLVRHLIYPVPDPSVPFLGVHLTRTVHGEVDAGPNAVLALGRHAYRRTDASLRDIAEMAAFPGLWVLLAENARYGLVEAMRSLSKTAFARAAQRLVPELTTDDLVPGPAGVRAQAIDQTGAMVRDFAIMAGEHSTHVLNAPSPAATASIAIGEHIASLALARCRR